MAGAAWLRGPPFPSSPARRKEKKAGADLPQNSADSRGKPNAATLSAVHKVAQGAPALIQSIDGFGTASATIPAKGCDDFKREGRMHQPAAKCGIVGARAAIAVAGMIALGLPARAAGAGFPDKPIKLIVPFGAGGPPDVASRIIAQYLSDHLGTVVVENHVGAGGTLAARAVASASPDGYTLMTATSGALSIGPQLYTHAGIDPIRQFAPIALIATTPLVLAVHKSVPVHSVEELVAYAKANPGKLNYGAVIGTPPQLSGEMFKILTGTDIVFVPYKSARQATTDVVAGQMNMTFEGTTGILPFIKNGQLRALAVTSPKRLSEIPDVPTMIEAGYSGMPPDAWQGMVAPAGTPPGIIAKINAVVNSGLATAEVKNRIVGLGGTLHPMSVKDFAAFMASQYRRWGEVLRATHVTLQ
jgi:tripartite-type tricarboxylate transporter receptor subunit TctC